MSRLMFIDTSRRRSPSTVNLVTCSRSLSISASVRSLILVERFTPATSQISFARERPMPKIAVSAMHACCWFGMLIPAIRATGFLLSLALLVPRIAADHAHHALAPHDLALAADFLDGSLHSHGRSPYLARNVIRALVKS